MVIILMKNNNEMNLRKKASLQSREKMFAFQHDSDAMPQKK